MAKREVGERERMDISAHLAHLGGLLPRVTTIRTPLSLARLYRIPLSPEAGTSRGCSRDSVRESEPTHEYAQPDETVVFIRLSWSRQTRDTFTPCSRDLSGVPMFP